MISQRARNGLDQWFTQALQGALSGNQGEQCSIEKMERNTGFPESRFVMLTSSSYLFRAFTLIYFDLNAATRAHFAKLSRATTDEMSEQAFMDVICERANMCGGAFNRDLGSVFNHIGLSTPNILTSGSAQCLDSLRTGHRQHFRIDITGLPVFHASLCVCEVEDLDFEVPLLPQGQGEVDSGELELF
jgi:hypothetical protein